MSNTKSKTNLEQHLSMALIHLMGAHRKAPMKFHNEPGFWIALETINNARRATRGLAPVDIIKTLDDDSPDIQEAITCINNNFAELVEETASWCTDGVNVEVISSKRTKVDSGEPSQN